MHIIFSVFFQGWAQQLGCSDVTPLPPIEMLEAVAAPEESKWLYRIESVDACGHVLQMFESIYLPHHTTLNFVPLVDGLRAYDAPNIHLIIRNYAT